MIVIVDDPDAAFRQALDGGATQLAEMHEEHGWRTGRLADPFAALEAALEQLKALKKTESAAGVD
jgi:hypothetical protein